eukprot:10368422-Ditylum_brightwellii.AAC.1
MFCEFGLVDTVAMVSFGGSQDKFCDDTKEYKKNTEKKIKHAKSSIQKMKEKCKKKKRIQKMGA